MARSSQEFALVGYSEDVEWRPLKFVEPIPAARICAACGHIPRKAYSLLCGHSFCEPCYGNCAASSSQCVCPLDGEDCATEDVHSRMFPAENLLRRKVHCWNEVNGCRVVLPASQVAEHFRHDCKHHLSSCPTCLAAVLRQDVCAHLKSQCAEHVFRAACGTQTGTDDDLKTLLVALEQKVERRVGEVDAKLAQLSLQSGSQNDKLVELCHNINHLNEALKGQLEAASGSQNDRHAELCPTINDLKEALKDQLKAASVKTTDSLDRNAAEIKALYVEKSDLLVTAVGTIMQSVQTDLKTHQWVLTGYAALKEKAVKEGSSESLSEKVYLRRYLISWGIYFKKDGDRVLLYMVLKLHKGRKDEFLEWPFKKELKLNFIHPATQDERNISVEPNVSAGNLQYYSRPADLNNRAVYFPEAALESSEVERDGYLKSDQLLLRIEVLL